MPNQNDIRQAITNQIISALESGPVPPWRRPWRIGKNAGAPANVVTKRSYRGLNPILLSLHAEKHQLTSKWYASFAQWKALGGRVMRRPDHVPQGAWACQICFWASSGDTIPNFAELGMCPRNSVPEFDVPGIRSLNSHLDRLSRKGFALNAFQPVGASISSLSRAGKTAQACM